LNTGYIDAVMKR